VLAVAENPKTEINSLEDLAKGARVAICAPEVPCGTLALEALEKAGRAPIKLENPSEEANVSNVATQVATGQVDAGFIYASDAAAIQRQGTKITTLPVEHVAPNKYPVASTDAGADNAKAAEFVRWLASPTAQRILAEHGFGPGRPKSEHPRLSPLDARASNPGLRAHCRPDAGAAAEHPVAEGAATRHRP